MSGVASAGPSQAAAPAASGSASAGGAGGDFSDVTALLKAPLRYAVPLSVDAREERHRYKMGKAIFYTEPHDTLTKVHFDGTLLHFAGYSGRVHSWDVAAGAQGDMVEIAHVVQDSDSEAENGEDMDELMDDRDAESGGAVPKEFVHVSAFDVSMGTLSVGSDDGTVGIWSDGMCDQLWETHTGRVSAIKESSNVLYTTSFDGLFLQRDLGEQGLIRQCYNHSSPLSDMIVQEQHLVMVSGWDGSILQLDLRTPQRVVMGFETGGHSPVSALTLRDDILYCAHGKGGIRAWDVRSQEAMLTTFEGHTDVVNALAVNNRHLLSASDDKTVRVFDIKTGACEDALLGHDEAVTDIAVVGSSLFTVSSDGSAREYSLTGMEAAVEFRKRRIEEARRLSQEAWLKHREEAKARKKKASKSSKKSKKKSKKKKGN